MRNILLHFWNGSGNNAQNDTCLLYTSGLTQSTISTWYRKNMLPTIPSLIKICDAFGLTLSQFFLEDDGNTIHITERQKLLLDYAAKLSPEQYSALLNFLKTL